MAKATIEDLESGGYPRGSQFRIIPLSDLWRKSIEDFDERLRSA